MVTICLRVGGVRAWISDRTTKKITFFAASLTMMVGMNEWRPIHKSGPILRLVTRAQRGMAQRGMAKTRHDTNHAILANKIRKLENLHFSSQQRGQLLQTSNYSIKTATRYVIMLLILDGNSTALYASVKENRSFLKIV